MGMGISTMALIVLVGVCLAGLIFANSKGRGKKSVPVMTVAPTVPKEERWQVRFAADWYECQPISADPSAGRGVVLLTDRRTHSRPIVRRLDEIKLEE